MVVLDGPKEIADYLAGDPHFWTKTFPLFFMAGVTGGINATELGLSVHGLTSTLLLLLYNLG